MRFAQSVKSEGLGRSLPPGLSLLLSILDIEVLDYRKANLKFLS